jgi:hypothetical protein
MEADPPDLELETKNNLEKIYLPRVSKLKTLDLRPELIVEESMWTCLDGKGNLASLRQCKEGRS